MQHMLVLVNKEMINQKKKSVFILGDSMVNHLNRYEISCKLPSKCKVYVRDFPGIKMRGMKGYLKPALRENSDHFILQVGTNDLNSERSPELIAKLIDDLTASRKMRTTMLVFQILLYALITRIYKKAVTVNKEL